MWYKNIKDLPTKPTLKISNWMTRPNNLGEAMRLVCKSLQLEILQQDFGVPENDETEKLAINDTTYFLRKIILLGDNQPFSFASVVIPNETYLKHFAAFSNLGTKLIGETLLYNSSTIREPFEFSFRNIQNTIFKNLLATKNIKQTAFYARRSIFKLNKTNPLLITEFLFETIVGYPN